MDNATIKIKVVALGLALLGGSCNLGLETDAKSAVGDEKSSVTAEFDSNKPGKLKYKKIVVGSLKVNCYLVWDANTKQGIIIDPGDEVGKITSAVAALGIKIKAIYATHCHFDHVGGVAALKTAFNVPFYIHKEDKEQLRKVPAIAKMMNMPKTDAPKADFELKAGDSIKVGGVTGTVIHTPGHSPGGVCFLFGSTLFSGDTLFKGSIGRTDLFKGSTTELLKSINTHLLTLDDNTKVFPGHGDSTTIFEERRDNPFLKGKYVYLNSTHKPEIAPLGWPAKNGIV